MEDSSSFSSLFALVDNHLSRSNIQQDGSQPSTSGTSQFRVPALNVQRGLSDTGLTLPSPRFPVPSLSLSEHPINNVLAKHLSNMLHSKEPQDENEESSDDDDTDQPTINDVLAIQLQNMFKAREAKEEERKKKEEELKRVEENLQRLKLEQSSGLIDLMPAVQQAGQVRPQDVEILSSGSSLESLVIPEATDSVDEEMQESIAALDIEDRPESPKPIAQDMRYILNHKIRARCSEFGKVLCARYRPVAAPYLKVYIPHPNIKVFDFSTPSPDDIVLARLKKPSMSFSSSSTLTVFD